MHLIAAPQQLKINQIIITVIQTPYVNIHSTSRMATHQKPLQKLFEDWNRNFYAPSSQQPMARMNGMLPCQPGKTEDGYQVSSKSRNAQSCHKTLLPGNATEAGKVGNHMNKILTHTILTQSPEKLSIIESSWGMNFKVATSMEIAKEVESSQVMPKKNFINNPKQSGGTAHQSSKPKK